MQLAVFTVMLPDLTPEEAAREISAAGYTGVEWRVKAAAPEQQNEPVSFWGNNLCTFAPTEEEAIRARDLSNRFGLATPNIGSYVATGDVEEAKRAVQFAKALGSPHFRLGTRNFGGDYARELEEAQQFLRDVIPLAKAAGVKPLVEIHHRMITASASLTHKLVSPFSPHEVGVIHDAGNMVHEGFEDYRLGLELLGDYLTEVHVKNAAFEPQENGVWQGIWAPLRSGVVDFDALFKALKRVGYDGWLVLEDFSQSLPSKEALRDNFDFVSSAWQAA